MTGADKKLPQNSSKAAIDAFIEKVGSTPITKSAGERGRLIFAMDATASREPTWDRACHIQGEMFKETAALGGLDIQLCYYRGFREFKASQWLSSSDELLKCMTRVSCQGGYTQIEKVLHQAIKQTKQKKVQALVFVGDCMEEDVDQLCQIAGELGMLGVPAFLFHEGAEPAAQRAFKQIARLTRGAYCSFDATSAGQLRDLLRAVAIYAAGGQSALQDFSKDRSEVVRKLTRQLGKD
ncbi:MAG: VWA domain-containing protein [Gammaproteobacteria bacterium]|nr:VWA domain-containing protein [Gammaproteobacteria bacterium]